MDGMTAQHALEMNPAIAKRAMTVWQDAYPAKPKALHFINMPSFMESIFNMVQSFQKQKMKERTIVHPRVCPFVTAYCLTTRSDPEIAFQILMTAYLLFLQTKFVILTPLCRDPWPCFTRTLGQTFCLLSMGAPMVLYRSSQVKGSTVLEAWLLSGAFLLPGGFSF